MEKLGNITLYNADCMDILKQTPDKYYSLCIVDPPYGIGHSLLSGEKRGSKFVRTKRHVDWDISPNEDYFVELFRVSKNQIIWGGNYFIDYLYNTQCFIIWDKKQPMDFSLSMCEMAWTSFLSPAKIFTQSVLKEQMKIHPTQKPVQLYKWILNKYAKAGDTILDTHLGSGSSAIAAHDGGFEFTGIELDEEYYNAAKERIILHQRQLNIF